MNSELLEQRRLLEAGFASENWSNLSFPQKLELCRELENNYAAEHGVTPCYVTAMPMDDGTYGYQTNHTIVLNSHVLEDGTFHLILRDENNQPILDENGLPVKKAVAIPASNWRTMETMYHEGTHGIQESEGRLASTYVDSECDYSLYRLQSCEKEAFSAGRRHTLDAIRTYEINNSHDPSGERYFNAVEKDSFDNYLNEAAERYHDPDIENTLNQFISDRDNGITPTHPSESYQAIAQRYDKHQGLTQQADNSLVSDNDDSIINSISDTTVSTSGTDINANDAGNGINAETNLTGSHNINDDLDDGYGVDTGNIDNEQNVSNSVVDDGYGVNASDDGNSIPSDSHIDDGYGITNSGTDGSNNSVLDNSGTSVSGGTEIE